LERQSVKRNRKIDYRPERSSLTKKKNGSSILENGKKEHDAQRPCVQRPYPVKAGHVVDAETLHLTKKT
jgi:hypothetical protein